ncbi:MAG: ParB/RepB/Spo0J family partition protein [Pseudomonadota bacterium]
MKEESLIWVDLAHVDEGPGPDCMSFGFDLDPLILSIRRCGLINNPLVARNEQGRVDVIAGYRRILALKTLGWGRVQCRDLSALLPSPLERLLFNLHDNLPTRTFNDVEKGMILGRLASLVPREALLNEHMPLLGLPSHEPLLRVYLQVEGMEEPVKRALAEGRIPMRTVRALLDLDLDSVKTLGRWLTDIIFNFNQQSQFIEYVRDISVRENREISELMSDEGLAGILRDPKVKGPHKAKHVLERLRQRRYPRLCRSQEAFQEKVKRLNLPEGVMVRFDPYFEDPHYHLDISFREGKALREKIVRLSQLEGLGKLGDPWPEDS